MSISDGDDNCPQFEDEAAFEIWLAEEQAEAVSYRLQENEHGEEHEEIQTKQKLWFEGWLYLER